MPFPQSQQRVFPGGQHLNLAQDRNSCLRFLLTNVTSIFYVRVSNPGAPTHSVYETPLILNNWRHGTPNHDVCQKVGKAHVKKTDGRSLSNTMATIRRRARCFEVLKATIIIRCRLRTQMYYLSRNKITISWRRQVTMTCKMKRGLMTCDDEDEMERGEEVT